MTRPRIAVLGTGLIGTSIGLGLTAAGYSVRGWDPNPRELEVAAGRGALASSIGPDDAIDGCDIIFLAGPLPAVIDGLQGVVTDALLTDVAGVKSPVVAAAAGRRFVGGHPMAGRESRGSAAASPSLFRGAAWVLTIDGAAESDLALVDGIVSDLGARPIRMSVEEHDDAVAMISHLPQVLAGVLLEAAAGTPALELAAGSFRDLTRVAASDPEQWTGVLAANSGHLGKAADRVSTILGNWVGQLDDGEATARRLQQARTVRRSLAPPVVAVRVALEDRPGELARVGRALASSAVDIRDLQLRHGLHGGGGVLTLAVRPGESEALRSALDSEGLTALA